MVEPDQMVMLAETAQDTLDKMKEGWNPFPEPQHLNLSAILFLITMYGYVLFFASNLISDGSELLLLVPSMAGIIGSIILPILGAVPDGCMVLFSCMGDDAQNTVSVGVGALAGSTVMLLTIPWFIAVVCGRVSIKDGVLTYKRPPGADAKTWDKLDPPGSFSMFHTGIGFVPEIKDSAKQMLFTLLGYLIIQIPAIFVDKSKLGMKDDQDELDTEVKYEAGFEKNFALVGAIVCMLEFCAYLYLQMKAGSEEKIAEVTTEALRDGQVSLRGVLAGFKGSKWACINDRNDLEEVVNNKSYMEEVRRTCKMLAPFFSQYDTDQSGTIDFNEFRMIFKDLGENLSKESVTVIFNAADTDNNKSINFEEFVTCLTSYACDVSHGLASNGAEADKAKFAKNHSKYFDDGFGQDADGDEEDDEHEEESMPEDLADLDPQEQQKRVKVRSLWMMSAGTGLVLVFSDPMVALLSEFGHRVDISPFYIAFVIAPLASNASELVSAYNYAVKRSLKSMGTSLSTLLGAGVMNNTFCLGIFLILVYLRGLAWDFMAETISIIVIEVLIGTLVLVQEHQRLLDGFIFLSFYPLCLAIVAFLENVVKLD